MLKPAKSKNATGSKQAGSPFAVMAEKFATPAFKPKTPLATDAALPFTPVRPGNPASQILGDSGSGEALRILLEATEHIKRADTLKTLREAVLRLNAGDWQGGSQLAIQALNIDEKCPEAWHVLAVARDKCNDFKTAITCYETALKLSPDNPAIANDIGRLAYRMGMTDLAEKFFRFFLDKCPGHIEAINNLATTLREASKIDEAIELLREAITANPADPQLWNALGTVVNAQGDMASSIIFYDEALKYDPNHVHARYNAGNAKATVGDIEDGLSDLLIALPTFVDGSNIMTCKLSIAFCHLHLGHYEEGWAWYDARNAGDSPESLHYLIDLPRWKKDDNLKGRRVFVSAEQGLGDEVLFASILPDLLREIGPEGKLGVAVESRLVPLFRRSFPEAHITRHHTTKHNGLVVRLFPEMPEWKDYDTWAVMGDFLGHYRPRIESFPASNPFLTPDPERVSYWKSQLDGLNSRPKIGILWKSLIKHARRDRYYSPFAQWEDILRTEGVQFVNLQYGDTSEELALAKEMGLDIWTPPGIDLKNDLDDLCALCVAMDCILCPANATSNIAGAAGATVWLLSPERSWTSLGTDHFPWYPSTRVFFSESLIDWTPVMDRIKTALIETFVDVG